MRLAWKRFFGLSLTLILLAGCGRSVSPTALSNIAVEASNREAKRIFGVEPFTRGDGTLQTDRDHSVWKALTSKGKADITAIVRFDNDGSIVAIDVKMMTPSIDPPVPAPNLDLFKQGLPETMPK